VAHGLLPNPPCVRPCHVPPEGRCVPVDPWVPVVPADRITAEQITSFKINPESGGPKSVAYIFDGGHVRRIGHPVILTTTHLAVLKTSWGLVMPKMGF